MSIYQVWCQASIFLKDPLIRFKDVENPLDKSHLDFSNSKLAIEIYLL